MKNYLNYQNLYNQLNNLNNIFNPGEEMPQEQMAQPATRNLYDPYQGFIRGNMFKDLYDPYKDAEPYKVTPANEQAEMLTKIDALCFACIDLNLYLDVFPTDREALEAFNRYRRDKLELTKQYEAKYGPLTLDSESLMNFPWAWDDKPWPWETR